MPLARTRAAQAAGPRAGRAPARLNVTGVVAASSLDPGFRPSWPPGSNYMPAESSFDIVSKLDRQEVDNALNQAGKEISTRFDFRNVGASIAWSGDQGVEIRANSEERAKAVLDVFKDKLVRRGVSLKVLDTSDPKLSGKEYRLAISLKEGITQDDAKKLGKIIRDEGPKGIKAQVQGDELRVSSKKKDDLQAVIALLKGKDFDFALQFVNYR